MGTIEVLVPVPLDGEEATSETFELGRPVRGVQVGLRLDRSWRSYFVVVDEWSRMLRDDGAIVEVLLAGDRTGPAAAETRTDVEEWAKLVEVGVVGLGN